MNSAERGARQAALMLLSIWGMVALSIGASGLMRQTTPLAIPAIVVLGSIGALLACYLSAPLRHWARTVSLHALLAVHLVRFVGIYFLYLHGRGQLPFEFGVIGGVGDIVVAATSIAVAWINRQPSHSARRILRIWNIAGLFDMALVVMIAGRYLHLAPEAIVPLRSLPLVLLPLYFVPLIIASHFLISIRLFWERRAPQ